MILADLPTILAALTPVLPYTAGLAAVAVACGLCLTLVAIGLHRPIRPADGEAVIAEQQVTTEEELTLSW